MDDVFQSLELGIDSPEEDARAVVPSLLLTGNYVCTPADYNKILVCSSLPSGSPMTITLNEKNAVPEGSTLRIENIDVGLVGFSLPGDLRPKIFLRKGDVALLSLGIGGWTSAVVKATPASANFYQWVDSSLDAVAVAPESFTVSLANTGDATYFWPGRRIVICPAGCAPNYDWNIHGIVESCSYHDETRMITVIYKPESGLSLTVGDTYSIWLGIVSVTSGSLPIQPMTNADWTVNNFVIDWASTAGPVKINYDGPGNFIIRTYAGLYMNPPSGYSVTLFNSGTAAAQICYDRADSPIVISGVESPILRTGDSITLSWDGNKYSGTVEPANPNTWSRYGIMGLSYVDATTFTVVGDMTSVFTTNRKIRAYADDYNNIVASGIARWSTYSASTGLTTVTCRLESGVLDSALRVVEYSILTPKDIPCMVPVIDTSSRVIAKTSVNMSFTMNSATNQTYTLPPATDIPTGAFYVISNTGAGIVTIVGTVNGIVNPVLLQHQTAYIVLINAGVYGGILPNKSVTLVSASRAITVADIGRLIVTTAGVTLTLPTTGVPPGCELTVINSATNDTTIAGTVSGISSPKLKKGEEITLRVANGVWWGKVI